MHQCSSQRNTEYFIPDKLLYGGVDMVYNNDQSMKSYYNINVHDGRLNIPNSLAYVSKNEFKMVNEELFD